jgi:hypothetical protein
VSLAAAPAAMAAACQVGSARDGSRLGFMPLGCGDGGTAAGGECVGGDAVEAAAVEVATGQDSGAAAGFALRTARTRARCRRWPRPVSLLRRRWHRPVRPCRLVMVCSSLDKVDNVLLLETIALRIFLVG